MIPPEFIKGIPKAELHLHIEGTLEPELLFELAGRNSIPLRFSSVDEVRKAYDFNNLQDFLDIYYQGASVLLKEEDFYDLTTAYLKRAHEDGVVHAEIFFDPQTHTERGIPFSVVVNGITHALEDGKKKLGISSKLIMCFLRHMSEESAFATLESSLPYKDSITAVGLDSSEIGNPPSKFERVFSHAQKMGFLVTAHAGEEGPASYVKESVSLLNADRIDHGNRILEDDDLVREVAERKIPLTLCPLSNLKLRVIKDMHQHPLKHMLDRGLLVSINSDDPAYFGGYVAENYRVVSDALALTMEDIVLLAKNSFRSSFLGNEEKESRMNEVMDFYLRHSSALS